MVGVGAAAAQRRIVAQVGADHEVQRAGTAADLQHLQAGDRDVDADRLARKLDERGSGQDVGAWSALPLGADGDVDESASGITVAGELEDLESGKSGTLTLDLAKGKYALICNISMPEGGMIEHHYSLGMHTGFTVE